MAKQTEPSAYNSAGKLRVRDVAHLENVSTVTVQHWVRSGVFPPEVAYKVGRVIRISPDYEQYLHRAQNVLRARRGQNKEDLSA